MNINSGDSHLSWVFTAYMLTSTVSAPVWGKLSDLYGRRLFLVLGVLIFIVAAVANGLSQGLWQLICFRAIQGFGAGMIMSCAYTLIGDLFAPAERARYQGIMAAVFGLASVIGPALGGFLTDNLSWRWAFFVSVPVGLLALPILIRFVPGRSVRRSSRIDFAGVGLLSVSATALLLAFVWGGQEYAWTSATIVALFATSVVVGLAFVLNERVAADPLIPTQLFRNSSYVVVALTSLISGMGMYGATVYMPLFVQGVIGKSATSSGTVTAPLMIGMVIASAVAGNIIGRTGRYKTISLVGAVVMVGGLALLSTMGAGTAQRDATVFMVVLGFGVGLLLPTLTVIVQNSAPPNLLGVVTSNVQFYRSMGGTIGVAIAATIVNNRIGGGLSPGDPSLSAVPASLLSRLQDPQTLVNPQLRAALESSFARVPDGPQRLVAALETLRGSLAEGITTAFLAGACVTALSIVVLAFLKEIPLRRTLATTAIPETAEAQVQTVREAIEL